MPIVKVIGRKDSNFRQLINYLHRLDGGEQDSFTYLHNILDVKPDDLQGIEQAFKDNKAYQKQRKNGVGQYHEIMSFHPKDTEYLLAHPEILEDFAHIYLSLRAPNTIAIARPHSDKEHLHLHFMISPNELQNAQSIRLNKKEFEALRRTIEEYQLEHYPELQHSYVHSRDQDRYPNQSQAPKKSHRQQQMEEAGKVLFDKKEVASTVQALLDSTDDLAEIKQTLQDYDMEIYYYNGRIQGVKYNGRKYRFSRLLEKDSPQMQIVNDWNKAREQEQNRAKGKGLEIEL